MFIAIKQNKNQAKTSHLNRSEGGKKPKTKLNEWQSSK